MHINLDKRSDYFFLNGFFQGGAQWEPGGCTTFIFSSRLRAPSVQPPGLNHQEATAFDLKRIWSKIKTKYSKIQKTKIKCKKKLLFRFYTTLFQYKVEFDPQ